MILEYNWKTHNLRLVMRFQSSPQIIKEGNLQFHSEWDNLNKITTNIYGSNVVNSAGGIMIQETKAGYDAISHETILPAYDRTREERGNVSEPAALPLQI